MNVTRVCVRVIYFENFENFGYCFEACKCKTGLNNGKKCEVVNRGCNEYFILNHIKNQLTTNICT